MDNEQQIDEIRKYRDYLSDLLDTDVDCNLAAVIWISKYARIWRLMHPLQAETCAQS